MLHPRGPLRSLDEPSEPLIMRICPACGARFTNEAAFCPHDGSSTVVHEDAVPDVDPLIGQVLDGRYRIDHVLGEGGMGIVYHATHAVLGKPMAIKVLRGEAAKDPDTVKRFVQEAQASSTIGHPNIVSISDFGHLPDGAAYFVMEHLEGETLTQLMLRQAPLSPRAAARILRGIGSAMAAAHARGIIHRDLKPDNVFMAQLGDPEPVVKILDFGIAKVGGSTSKLTRAGQVFGTPHYMSPEQCAGSGVDHRTDIYALGVILYEMVTGSVPFDADNLMGILTKHLYEPPKAPREINPNVPADLETVVQRCMAKDAEQRYQTMAEVVADLDRLDAGIRPDATNAFRTAAATSAALPQQRSKKPLFIGAALLVLLGAGAVGASVLFGDSPTPPAVAQPIVAPPPDPTPVAAPPTAPAVGTAVAEAPRVSVTSVPPGAEVWRGDELLGNTPLELPRPSGDDRLELEARSAGYVSQHFVLSRLTVAEQLRITLEAERTHRRPSGRRTHEAEAAMTETPTPAMTTDMRRHGLPQSEVLDPWAAGGN